MALGDNAEYVDWHRYNNTAPSEPLKGNTQLIDRSTTLMFYRCSNPSCGERMLFNQRQCWYCKHERGNSACQCARCSRPTYSFAYVVAQPVMVQAEPHPDQPHVVKCDDE